MPEATRRREWGGLSSIELYKDSVLKGKRVMEMDSGEVYTLRMYLIPLNCPLKMVKMVNFILYLFYYDKKNMKKTIFTQATTHSL